MSNYRPVYTRIWRDKNFKRSKKDAKLLFLYLISNEDTNNSGIYQIAISTISAETGIPVKGALKLLTDGSMKNITYDWENGYVFIHNMQKYSPGGRPKHVGRGILREHENSKITGLWKKFDQLYPSLKISGLRLLYQIDMTRPARRLWEEIRGKVFLRDCFTCQYCGQFGGKLECDHIIPVASGGSHDIKNLATSCFFCNRSKGDKSLKEWIS